MWDLLARGPAASAQRELIAHAIGPIWEANHVWLILVVVLLFTCFPPAFAAAGHRPAHPALADAGRHRAPGIGLHFPRLRRCRPGPWGRIFAVASLVTPLLLGVSVGAIATGRVRPPDPAAGFVAGYVAPWATPFSLATGLLPW